MNTYTLTIGGSIIVKTRKNRKTGVTVILLDNRLKNNGDWYAGNWELLCFSHKYSELFYVKKTALSLMAHPDEWCTGCMQCHIKTE